MFDSPYFSAFLETYKLNIYAIIDPNNELHPETVKFPFSVLYDLMENRKSCKKLVQKRIVFDSLFETLGQLDGKFFLNTHPKIDNY